MVKFAISILILFQSIISFNQCDDFAMTFDVSQPTCYNYSDGNINVTLIGGTAPYHCEITNENGIIVDNGKKTFQLMGGGWYYIYASDGNSCELYDSVYLVNPAQMIAQMTITDPSSTVACDGIAEVDTVLNYQGDFNSIGYFWSPGGPLGLGENIKTDLCDANYNLVINDEYGCSITEYLAIGSVSVSEIEPIDAIALFPNPVQTEINFSGIEIENSEIVIYSLYGKVILQKKIVDENKIDVSEMPRGNYILKVITETGVYSFQIVKD